MQHPTKITDIIYYKTIMFFFSTNLLQISSAVLNNTDSIANILNLKPEPSQSIL